MKKQPKPKRAKPVRMEPQRMWVPVDAHGNCWHGWISSLRRELEQNVANELPDENLRIARVEIREVPR